MITERQIRDLKSAITTDAVYYNKELIDFIFDAAIEKITKHTELLQVLKEITESYAQFKGIRQGPGAVKSDKLIQKAKSLINKNQQTK